MASSSADVVGRVLEAGGLVLERARLLGSRRPIVVAVSGGADSLCLLDVMVTLLEGGKRRIVVGHVDHKLRPESAGDAEHVRAASDRYGVRCETFDVDVPSLAAAERRGVEEAARLGRYRALRDLAHGTEAAAVVTGHTRDDSVETVLLHLLRGSGTRGLRGISEVERFSAWSLGEAVCSRATGARLIRPLLGVSRAETVRYCEARGIRWIVDETNTDPRFLRNRVRGHLLPVLRTYNPAFDDAALRMSRTLSDEDAWLEAEVQKRWRRIGKSVDGGATLDLAGWRRQPVAIRRRLVREVAATLGYDSIGFEAAERALAVGTTDGPLRAELGGGLRVERRGALLVFTR